MTLPYLDAGPMLSQVLQAQKARLTERSTATGTLSSARQFHLTYDTDPELRKIDVGGDDQALRYGISL